MLGREFIRDRHAVTGQGDYRGESSYQWDAAAKRVVYRTWNTNGDVTDGRLLVRGTALHTEDEEYRGKDGPVRPFRSVITPLGEAAYDVATHAYVEQEWRPVRMVRYTRVDAVTASGGAPHERAVAELRSTWGTWDVPTEFLQPDGSVARAARGTYLFDWIVETACCEARARFPTCS